MRDEMTPQAALAAVASARSAASSSPAVPGWFPAASVPAFTAGLTLVGASLLASGIAAWVLGLAGAVALAGFAALWVTLALWWRRGVVPAAPRLDRRLSPRRRRAELLADFAAVALSLATLAITGRLGWGAIAAGWLLGAALWYRLRSRAA